MAYVFRVRRGTRHVDEAGNTVLKADGTPVRDDWGSYTAKENHTDPLEGELVVEFEYNEATGKTIPRLKIGDGQHTFAELDYLGIESFIFPTNQPVTTYITLTPDTWQTVLDDKGNEVSNRFYQPVTVIGAEVTQNSKIDLQPSPEQLVIFREKDIAFTAVNSGGDVKVYVVGEKPAQEYTIQVTITEVSVNGDS